METIEAQPDETQSLRNLVEATAANLEAGQRGHVMLTVLGEKVDEYRQLAPHWRDLDNDLTALAHRVDALRARFATPGDAAEPPTTITVEQLAQSVSVSSATARKLLDQGQVPGARRKSPGVRNSPWIIPADAPEKYLAQLEAREA